MTDLPKTRKSALIAGSKYYFTGKPCPHGHIAPRFVSNSACQPCLNKQSQNYFKKNPDYFAAKMSRWVQANRDKNRENSHRWYHENIEKAREQSRARYALNPEPKKESERSRRSGKIGRHKAATVSRLRTLQKNKCYWCRKRLGVKIHVDHIFALKLGGTHEFRNLCLAHPSCNLHKSAKTPAEFAGRLF